MIARYNQHAEVKIPLTAALSVEVNGELADEARPALDFVNGGLTRLELRLQDPSLLAPRDDDGEGESDGVALLATSPTSMRRVSSTSPGRRAVLFHVHAGEVDLRTRLRGKWLSKPLWEGLVEPFVEAHNERSDAPNLDASDLIVEVDGMLVDYTLPIGHFVDPTGRASDITHVTLWPSLGEHRDMLKTNAIQLQLENGDVVDSVDATQMAPAECSATMSAPAYQALEAVYGQKSPEELQQWAGVAMKVCARTSQRIVLRATP